MKAMVFAAGLGTRLRPLTHDRPKALVEVGGYTLLELAIRRLRAFGYDEIVVNVHHFADQIEDLLQKNNNFGATVHISDERLQLLDTGGGLKQAAQWLKGGASFLVHNVDVLTNLDLHALRRAHEASGALATLAVRERQTSRYLLFDEAGLLSGWENTKTGEKKISRAVPSATPLAFSGIQYIHPRLFDYMPEQEVFSIIGVYLDAARTAKVAGFRHDDTDWLDVGKPDALEPAAKLAKAFAASGFKG
ncbi:MAG: nucleotidyltransferase family protein [Phaeodactylibacter sp.]|uniref:nucleotidyltransferase family protein n=1 Tax=Phaeodactylibacter sp. TaxID=1940289 RepID=UPI0032EF4CA5